MRTFPVVVRASIVTLSALALASLAHQVEAAARPYVAPFYSYPAEPNAFQPMDIAVADFNGDGRMDAALPCNNGVTVSVLMNNADNTYGPAAAYVTAHSATCIAAADLNGDGRPDLVVGEAVDSISVLINNGNGTFKTRVNYATPNLAWDVATGDVNGDGKPDVLVADGTSDKVSLWLNTGTGALGARTDIALPVGSNARSVAFADLNHDGKLDAFAGGTQSVILIGAGNGTFVPTTLAATLPDATLGDLDGDGTPDLVAGDGNHALTVRLGLGNGMFGAATTYSPVGFNSAPVVLADVNRDGRPDVLVGGAMVSLFVNEGGGALGPVRKFFTGALGPGLAAAIPAPGGRMSLFLPAQQSNSMLVMPGNGDSTLLVSPPVTLPLPSGTGLTFARLTGGPYPDVVEWSSGSGACTVLPNTGPAAFGAPVSIAGSGAYDVGFGDLNSDAQDDIIVSNAFVFPAKSSTSIGTVLNQGGGAFSSKSDVTMPNQDASPLQLVSGDFDGDGHVDAIVYASAGPIAPQLLLYHGDGAGGFAAPVVESGAFSMYQMLGADVNGDGKLDLVIGQGAGGGTGTITVLPGNGAGGFGTAVVTNTIDHPYDMSLGDLNGDGRPDLVVSTGTGAISTMLNNGALGFATRHDRQIGSGVGNARIADIDGDGRGDVICGNSVFLFCYLHGAGDGTFDDRQDYAGGSVIAQPADVDGDGVPDLVVGGSATQAWLFRTNMGTLAAPAPRGAATVALAAAPNPARMVTTLRWSMAATGRATLRVIDVAGREVARPFDAVATAGAHEARWNGATAAPGVYFAELVTAAGRTTTRMAVMR